MNKQIKIRQIVHLKEFRANSIENSDAANCIWGVGQLIDKFKTEDQNVHRNKLSKQKI